jgi:transposase InsO family protein
MMLDANIVAVSPASVWRVLSRAGLQQKWNGKPSKKGTGFDQPPQPHQHWHIDVSYLNVCATFYYLCSILDGYRRFLVHCDLREQMTEADIEIVLEQAKERYSGVKPRIISDNGRQFYRQGLQGVHSHFGYDARPNFTLLPAIERQNRTLAQITQRGVHPPWHAVVGGRCTASG